MATQQSSSGSRIAASAGLGVIAAALGYLVSFLLVADEVPDDVATWKGVAWYFYNGHMVDVVWDGSFGGLSGGDAVNLIAESGSTSAQALYVVPPLVLLGVGMLLAYNLDSRDLGEAVSAGAPVAVGYAIVLGLGVLIAESSGAYSFVGVEISGSVAPALVPAVVLGGVLYPLVFATAGAVLVTGLR